MPKSQLVNRHRQRAKQAGKTEEVQPACGFRSGFTCCFAFCRRTCFCGFGYGFIYCFTYRCRTCRLLGDRRNQSAVAGAIALAMRGSNAGIHVLNNGGHSAFGSTAAEIGTDQQAPPERNKQGKLRNSSLLCSFRCGFGYGFA